MNLKDVEETSGLGPAPKGRYKGTFTAAEAKTAKSGADMLALTGEITEGNNAGGIWFDNLITDGSKKGAGFAKSKLRGLGINVELAQDDAQVAQQLLGRTFFVDLDLEPIMTQGPSGKYDVPKTYTDAQGVAHPSMRNIAKAYYVAGPVATVAAPQAQIAPAPAAPAAPAAPVAQGQVPPQFAQQGWGNYGAPPQGFNGNAPQYANPTWGAPPPPEAAAPSGKRSRK